MKKRRVERASPALFGGSVCQSVYAANWSANPSAIGAPGSSALDLANSTVSGIGNEFNVYAVLAFKSLGRENGIPRVINRCMTLAAALQLFESLIKTAACTRSICHIAGLCTGHCQCSLVEKNRKRIALWFYKSDNGENCGALP